MFPIGSLTWLLVVNSIYLVVGLLDVYFKWWPTEYVQAVWICILSLPLWIPMQRFIMIDPIWTRVRR